MALPFTPPKEESRERPLLSGTRQERLIFPLTSMACFRISMACFRISMACFFLMLLLVVATCLLFRCPATSFIGERKPTEIPGQALS